MEIKGMTPDQLRAVVDQVSRDHYDGNIAVGWEGLGWPRLLNQAGTRFRGRVLARSSRGPGARRAGWGRRLTAACWHVFRDVIREALAQYPQATFRTSMARYTAANFEATYPATGNVNVGSMMEPVTMPELCECHHDAVRVVVAWPRSVGTTTTATGSCNVTTPEHEPDVDRLIRRIDAVSAMTPGVCGWCGSSTGTEAMTWCSEDCQDAWRDKYAVS